MSNNVRCANCGKHFEIDGDQWGYAYGKALVCSYRCMRDMRAGAILREEKREKERELKAMGGKQVNRKPRGILTDEDRAAIYRMRMDGKSYDEIAAETGIERKHVYNYCYRNNIYPAGPEATSSGPSGTTFHKGEGLPDVIPLPAASGTDLPKGEGPAERPTDGHAGLEMVIGAIRDAYQRDVGDPYIMKPLAHAVYTVWRMLEDREDLKR